MGTAVAVVTVALCLCAFIGRRHWFLAFLSVLALVLLIAGKMQV